MAPQETKPGEAKARGHRGSSVHPHTPAAGLEQGRSRALTAGPAHSGCQVALLLAAGPLGQRAWGFWLLWPGGRFRWFQDLFPVTSISWPVFVNLAWGRGGSQAGVQRTAGPVGWGGTGHGAEGL